MKASQIIKGGPADDAGLIDGDVIIMPVSYTHLTLPTNREV